MLKPWSNGKAIQRSWKRKVCNWVTSIGLKQKLDRCNWGAVSQHELKGVEMRRKRWKASRRTVPKSKTRAQKFREDDGGPPQLLEAKLVFGSYSVTILETSAARLARILLVDVVANFYWIHDPAPGDRRPFFGVRSSPHIVDDGRASGKGLVVRGSWLGAI